jgi:protein CWC15
LNNSHFFVLPLQGGEEQGGMRFYAPSAMRSVKDAAGFTTIKYRQEGQATADDLKGKDFKAELEARERQHFLKNNKQQFLKEQQDDLRLLEEGIAGDGEGPPPVLVPKAVDADEAEDEEESDDSDDSDDEEELLARELARIKQERAEEAARKAAAEAAEREAQERAEALGGNPLLHQKLAGASGLDVPTFAVKRRWDEDVVFRNQSRSEPKQQRRFINDTIRNDFHRRFLDRYMK